MLVTEVIFGLVKKYPGYEVSLGYNEKRDWYEVYIRYGSMQIVKAIPSWLSEMYSIDAVNRTIRAGFEELAASVERRGSNEQVHV